MSCPGLTGASSTPRPACESPPPLEYWITRFAGDDVGTERMTNSKATLRAKALAKRDALSDKKRASAAAKLGKRGLPFELLPGSVVSGYSPIRSEIDPIPLMQKLAAEGARLALPCVSARGQSLIFRIWHPNDRLMLGPLGFFVLLLVAVVVFFVFLLSSFAA